MHGLAYLFSIRRGREKRKEGETGRARARGSPHLRSILSSPFSISLSPVSLQLLHRPPALLPPRRRLCTPGCPRREWGPVQRRPPFARPPPAPRPRGRAARCACWHLPLRRRLRPPGRVPRVPRPPATRSCRAGRALPHAADGPAGAGGLPSLPRGDSSLPGLSLGLLTPFHASLPPFALARPRLGGLQPGPGRGGRGRVVWEGVRAGVGEGEAGEAGARGVVKREWKNEVSLSTAAALSSIYLASPTSTKLSPRTKTSFRRRARGSRRGRTFVFLV